MTSPVRRTALVLCGTGAHGAYHAGVLRALHEAGVKVDVVAGHGVGAAGALLVAAHGGPRLWEPGGLWHALQPRDFYRWTGRARALVALGVTTVAHRGRVAHALTAGANACLSSNQLGAVALADSRRRGGARRDVGCGAFVADDVDGRSAAGGGARSARRSTPRRRGGRSRTPSGV